MDHVGVNALSPRRGAKYKRLTEEMFNSIGTSTAGFVCKHA